MTTRENLRMLRLLLGKWSQQRLAQEMGVAMQTINRWETGTVKLSARALMRLRKLVKDLPDTRPLAFIEEQISDLLEEEEILLFGTTMRLARRNWVEIAERNWHMRQALKAVEWMEIFPGTSICPVCDEAQASGHTPDCLIGNALSYEHNEESGKPHHGGDAAQVE